MNIVSWQAGYVLDIPVANITSSSYDGLENKKHEGQKKGEIFYWFNFYPICIVLSVEEVKAFFADKRYYAFNLIAATTACEWARD